MPLLPVSSPTGAESVESAALTQGENGEDVMTEILRTVTALRARVAAWRAQGEAVGLVPTMGALHAGHRALVETAGRECRRVVASIFVNPRQFGPREDFAAYPRDEAKDLALLNAAGADLAFVPAVTEMYPEGFATAISIAGGLTQGLCAAQRPGHFDGVATVVAKLLIQTAPDRAYFGEKDYQQLLVVRRLAADLDLAITIVGVPTVREADGLALSSRNAYLSPADRAIAPTLHRVLQTAAADIARDPGTTEARLRQAQTDLATAGFAPEYVELRDAATLAPIGNSLARPARLLAAARLGRTRLIDNIAVLPAPTLSIEPLSRGE
jgi:pantoate--beta-alanine ligase